MSAWFYNLNICCLVIVSLYVLLKCCFNLNRVLIIYVNSAEIQLNDAGMKLRQSHPIKEELKSSVPPVAPKALFFSLQD